MSTAYPPRLIKYLFKSQSTRKSALASTPRPNHYGDFPPSFGLYYAGPGKDFLSQDFYLAESIGEDPPKEDDALYAVIFHKGPGSRQCTIYDGPVSEKGRAMAVATSERRWGDGVVVKVPTGEGGGDGWREEKLRSKNFSTNDYVFDCEGTRYEWREDLSKRPHTRRLVRCGSGDEVSTTGSTRSKDSADLHVVATWTEGSVPNRSWQIGWFRLADESMASNAYFILLAVISVLAACQRGASIEGTMSWHEEKMLERSNYSS